MSNYSKTILCLANSRKTSGRCIAGRELSNGQLGAWIRPVSARQNAELSEEDRRFENGRDPRVLDIIRIPMIEPKPHAFQIENHLIDAQYYWTFEGRGTWQQALAALDNPIMPLWSNTSSSYSGLHDRVAEANVAMDDGSLRLIRVDDLQVNVAVEGAEFGNGKRKVRGRFTHGEVQYHLSITDPPLERKYLLGANGVFPVGSALLCVSLSEPFNGWTYKLIASVITP